MTWCGQDLGSPKTSKCRSGNVSRLYREPPQFSTQEHSVQPYHSVIMNDRPIKLISHSDGSEASIFTCYVLHCQTLEVYGTSALQSPHWPHSWRYNGRAVNGSRLERQPSTITAQLAIVICQNHICDHQPGSVVEISSFGANYPQGPSVLALRLNCHFEQRRPSAPVRNLQLSPCHGSIGTAIC